VKLDPHEIDAAQIRTVSEQGIEETEHRIRELRDTIRTDHLNNMERRSIVKICEDYNDIYQETDCQSLPPQSMRNQHRVEEL
jgi:ferritin-like metal-binding protein YciE